MKFKGTGGFTPIHKEIIEVSVIKPSQIIGKNKSDAISFILQNAYKWRVVCEDGSYTICGRDFDESRFNLTIDRDIITNCAIG